MHIVIKISIGNKDLQIKIKTELSYSNDEIQRLKNKSLLSYLHLFFFLLITYFHQPKKKTIKFSEII